MRVLRRPRALAAVLIAGALLASGASLPTLRAAANTPEPTDEAVEAAPEQLELIVAPEAPVLTQADTEARFTVLLRNESDVTAPEGSVELALGQPLTGPSATQPAATVPEEPAGGEGQAATPRTIIATVAIDAVAAGGEQSATVAVPIKDIPVFTAASRGVYPLYATYAASDSAVATPLTTFSPLVWEGPDTAAKVKLATIVPLTLPSSVQSMPSRPQLSEAIPRLDALLEYAQASQSVLAIDPRIVAAIRGYGTEAPRAATELLEKLETTTLPSFLLQFGDADPAAQAALGLEALLQPAGFEFVTRFGAWEPATAPDEQTGEGADDPTNADPQDPTGDGPGSTGGPAQPEDATAPNNDPASDEPDEPADPADSDPSPDAPQPPPSDEELTAWDHGLAGAWPAAGQASNRTLALLRGAGLDLTVLSSDNVRLAGGPRATLGDGTALVTDAELDTAVRLAMTGQTDTERALGRAQAAARIALAASSGIEGLILGVDRGGAAEATHPEDILESLTGERWIDTVAPAGQPAGTAQLIAGTPDEERIELLGTALENEADVLEIRALLADPEYLDSYQRQRLLTLFGTKNAVPEANFPAVAAQFAKRDGELREGVRLVDTKRAQLVGGSTRIPIQLRNSLPFDVVVSLEVAPTSAALALPERHFTDIHLPEDSSEHVLVPTNSRVSSGESALLLSVSSLDGEFTASTGRLEVAISSAVETVAITLLGTAAALLFGFGIWRSVRRRKSLSPRE